MTTMTADDLSKKTGQVRQTLIDGNEVMLTFHGKPYARVIADERVEEERAELERLRAEVERLQDQLEQQGAPSL